MLMLNMALHFKFIYNSKKCSCDIPNYPPNYVFTLKLCVSLTNFVKILLVNFFSINELVIAYLMIKVFNILVHS
jgi:hypothetical protein